MLAACSGKVRLDLGVLCEMRLCIGAELLIACGVHTFTMTVSRLLLW